MEKKYTVELRNGKKVLVETEVDPPTPPIQKDLFAIRTLEYMKISELFVKLGCENYGYHGMDGTEAEYKITTRFHGSRVDIVHVLCEDCKENFVREMGGMYELTPITNRGSKNT